MEKEREKPLNLDTPLLSLNALLNLLEIEDPERMNAMTLIMMVTEEENRPVRSPGLLHAYKGIIKKLPPETVKKIEQILEKIAAARESFLRDQQRTFYSLDDAVQNMIDNKSVPAKLVKAMLGGQWPNHPFGFECIGSYTMTKDGALVPDDGTGIEAPGPDFRLQFQMVNDPLA